MLDISIVVTSFNVGPYLSAAVASIVDGIDAISYEVIIVDDGSTDSSPSIAESLASRYHNVRTILFKDRTVGGVASAANAGINAAKGEFLGFLDGDDIVLPGTFDKLVWAAKSGSADIAICGFATLMHESGVLVPQYDRDDWSQLVSTPVITGDHIFDLLYVSPEPWRKIYRRAFLGENLRFPVVENYFEDVPFHWAIIHTAKSAAICDFIGFHHRGQRSGQTTYGDADRRAAALFHYAELVKSESVSAHRVAQMALLAWFIRGLSWIRGDLSPEVACKVMSMARDLLNRFPKKDIAIAAARRQAGGKLIRRNRRAFLALMYLSVGAKRLFLRRLAAKKITNGEIWMTHLVWQYWRRG